MDLTWKRPLAWENYTDDNKKSMEAVAGRYIGFLSAAKTERLAVDTIVSQAKAAGYVDISTLKNAEPGTKCYWNQNGKAVVLFVIGKKPMVEGLRIVGAHVDNPRLDLKPNPLYESNGLAFFDTHYYGGVKKYQWTALPLALHGVVVCKDGRKVLINIGEDASDPVLGITDLLPHLGRDQMEKTMSKGITGEGLDALVASTPVPKDKDENGNDKDVKDPVKQWVLRWLHDKYQISEADFTSADLQLVPAGPAREYGLERSFIMGFGHDDRVCSWAAWAALLDMPVPEYTSAALLTDKEEVGSIGATGAEGHFFEDAVAELLALQAPYTELALRRCLRLSKGLSGDVSNGYDPLYAEVSDPNNSAYMGKGFCICRYVGGGGKGGTIEATPEFMAWLRALLDGHGICWQVPELGKVDQGGGGTIAKFLGNYGMDCVDAGIPLFSMHAPWELAHKADLYEMYRAFTVFYQA